MLISYLILVIVVCLYLIGRVIIARYCLVHFHYSLPHSSYFNGMFELLMENSSKEDISKLKETLIEEL